MDEEQKANIKQAVNTLTPFLIVAVIAYRRGKSAGVASAVSSLDNVVPTLVEVVDNAHLSVTLSNGRVFPFRLQNT
jgi:hypothetical protein